MQSILKIEEGLMFLLGVWAFLHLGYPLWEFAVWILAPDISLIGYTLNPKVGAFCYNLFHHKGFAIGVFLGGYYAHSDPAMLAGIILFAHSSMDRIFGFGLKYEDSFKHTHLGGL